MCSKVIGFRDTIMKALLGLVFLLYITSATCEDDVVEIDCPSCIKMNQTCYNLTYITDLRGPFRNKVVIPKMVLMRSRNILFYTLEPQISDEEYYKVAFVGLDDKETFGIVPFEMKQIYNFGTFDIDQDNDVIYLGGSKGIFAMNFRTNTTVPFSSFGDTILDLFYKGYVYFVRYGENKIIQKKGEFFEYYFPGSEANVKMFVINKNYVTAYLTNLGLFLHRNGEDVKISKNAYFRGLTVDLDGNIYAWWIDGIYKVVIEKKLAKSKVVKVADMPSIGAMAFDNNNNIIFSYDKKLYRLEPTPASTVC